MKALRCRQSANDEDLQKVDGSWIAPPDVPMLFADSDRVVTF